MAKREVQKEYTESHKEVKKSIKQDKRKYVDNLAQQAEEAAGKRNMKEVHDITRKLADNRQTSEGQERDNAYQPKRPTKTSTG